MTPRWISFVAGGLNPAATVLGLLVLLANGIPHLGAEEILTQASQVLALPAKTAGQGIPIRLRGVVTDAEPDWAGRFFMQDDTGGVFVDNSGHPCPQIGDDVEVSGLSHPGGYAPCLTLPQWKKIGTAPLPAARRVPLEQLMAGTEDGQRVEVSGVVRAATLHDGLMALELVAGGFRLRAYTPILTDVSLDSLVGREILLRGTDAASFNFPLRQLLTVVLYVPRVEDVVLSPPASVEPFSQPLTPLNSIAQYRPHFSPGDRVRVKGIVSYQSKGMSLFLQDEHGALEVKTRQTNTVAPGEIVEAVGFPAVKDYLPVLEDVLFRKTGAPRLPLQPQTVTIDDLQAGLHHAELISVTGRLVDRLVNHHQDATSSNSVRTTLVLQTTNFVFTAERETAEVNSLLTAIPLGSLVQVTGICLLDSDESGKIYSMRLLLPASYDVRVLAKPSWLTAPRLLVMLAVVFVILLLAMIWNLMIANKNNILRGLMREKEIAQNELQAAHDQLEARVWERTAQLKVEMTARKESELQFRAGLTERTRLAQELHDTLEQSLTGIVLQMDLVSSQFAQKPAEALNHLQLARNLMHQSQVDLRRSVWGLRIRAEDQFDLVQAITVSCRQIAADTGMQIHVEVNGAPRQLPEIIEENFLRIAQEAVTNAVKHSGAKQLGIRLQFSPEKTGLHIADDGRGFAPENCPGPKDGHFGLQGIRERAERMGGEMRVASGPDAGTTLQVEIPTAARADKTLP
jgi:signal transduction histidine kinase